MNGSSVYTRPRTTAPGVYIMARGASINPSSRRALLMMPLELSMAVMA